MAWRMSYYFVINGVLLVPILAKIYNIKVYKGSGIKMLLSTFIVFCYGIYLIWLIYGGQPYKFFILMEI